MKLILFDVDGTLINSLSIILKAMGLSFQASGIKPPTDEMIKSIIGLSLPLAIAKLAPQEDAQKQYDLVQGYKTNYSQLRGAGEGGVLFDGAADLVTRLAQRNDVLLGIATGKSRKGTVHFLQDQQWQDYFATVQTADDAPSKPHPQMIEQALEECGVSANDTMMIGDTVFDLEMAVNARVCPVGVSWGYHSAAALKACKPKAFVSSVNELTEVIETFCASVTING